MSATEETLATLDELTEWSQEQEAVSDLLVVSASAVVRDYCGWRIAPSGQDSTVLPWRGGPLLLPTLHMRSLDKVVVAGATQDLTGWDVYPDGVVRPAADSLWNVVSRRDLRTEVTFTHGHDEVPAAVRAVVLSLATRMLVNPASETQESVGGYAVTYAQGATAGLLSLEKRILDRHRIPPRP